MVAAPPPKGQKLTYANLGAGTGGGSQAANVAGDRLAVAFDILQNGIPFIQDARADAIIHNGDAEHPEQWALSLAATMGISGFPCQPFRERDYRKD